MRLRLTQRTQTTLRNTLRVQLIRGAIATTLVGAIVGISIFIYNTLGTSQTALANTSSILIWEETFDQPDGTKYTSQWWTETVNTDLFNGDYFEVRNNRFEARDTDGEAMWYSKKIYVGDYKNVLVEFMVFEEGDLEPHDYFSAYYKLDGGPEKMFKSNGYLSDDFSSELISQTGLNGDTLEIIFRANNNSNPELYYVDVVTVRAEQYANTQYENERVYPFAIVLLQGAINTEELPAPTNQELDTNTKQEAIPNISEVYVGPNPFYTAYTLYFYAEQEGEAKIYVQAMNGALVSQYIMAVNSGNNQYTITDNAGLSPGVYFVSIYQQGKMLESVKMIKAN